MATIAAMRAAGLSAEQIVDVLEQQEQLDTAAQRERWRENTRRYRARHRSHDDTDDTDDKKEKTPIPHKRKTTLSIPSESRERRRAAATPFRQDWKPASLAPQQQREFARFRDSALAHDRRYVDWEAAWRNWLRSPWAPASANGADLFTAPDDDDARNREAHFAALRAKGLMQ